MKNIKEVELFLFDMDGTVYIGDREIEGSFDALRELKKLGKKVCLEYSPSRSLNWRARCLTSILPISTTTLR